MFNHYREGLDIRALLAEANPLWILELGIGACRNTQLLLEHAPVLAVSDNLPIVTLPYQLWDGCWPLPSGLSFVQDISYLFLEGFPSFIYFAIVDTDHNSWTLSRELQALSPSMPRGSVVCVHDTEAFATTNGFAERYLNNARYPSNAIHADERPYTAALTDAPKLIEFKRSTEFSGAVALRRV